MCDAAQRLGGDKVRPALELVGCAEEVERAIKYTFGSAFVCQVRGQRLMYWEIDVLYSSAQIIMLLLEVTCKKCGPHIS